MVRETEQKMVIGVSSRALFDLTIENEIFETQGVNAYCRYQREHEGEVMKPGPGFGLVKALLHLNDYCRDEALVEVVVMSRNSPDASLRMFHSIEHYGLAVTRAVLAGGASLAPYLTAFQTDLFLSAYEEDVQYAVDCGIAAGTICTEHVSRPEIIKLSENGRPGGRIRIAFDGDSVLFTDESERIFQEKGLFAFEENERRNAKTPLAEGPFACFLKKLSGIQKKIGQDRCPIRTALVTSRSIHAQERVVRTLRSWGVKVDEAFFLGGMEKKEFLKAFGAQIFFDDQSVHTLEAAREVPAARVPYRKASGIES